MDAQMYRMGTKRAIGVKPQRIVDTDSIVSARAVRLLLPSPRRDRPVGTRDEGNRVFNVVVSHG
jgi:hypothetical protein